MGYGSAQPQFSVRGAARLSVRKYAETNDLSTECFLLPNQERSIWTHSCARARCLEHQRTTHGVAQQVRLYEEEAPLVQVKRLLHLCQS